MQPYGLSNNQRWAGWCIKLREIVWYGDGLGYGTWLFYYKFVKLSMKIGRHGIAAFQRIILWEMKLVLFSNSFPQDSTFLQYTCNAKKRYKFYSLAEFSYTFFYGRDKKRVTCCFAWFTVFIYLSISQAISSNFFCLKYSLSSCVLFSSHGGFSGNVREKSILLLRQVYFALRLVGDMFFQNLKSQDDFLTR